MIEIIKGILVVLGILLLITLIACIIVLPWIFADKLAEKEHLKFLSKELSCEVLSYKDWMILKNVEDDEIVRSAYRKYIQELEEKVKNRLV